MIVGLLGDVEGDLDWTVARLRTIGDRGDVSTVLQLGDLRFGMGPDPDGYLAAVEAACAEEDLRLWCIGGNHENWALLDKMWAASPTTPLPLADHVTMVPRGHRFELDGRSFVALGGAPSINVTRLTEGVDWWPTEVIEEADVERTVAGGAADVMLTHDSPGPPWCTAPVAEIIEGNPWGWPDSSLAYAREGIDRVQRAVLGVAPRLLVHGHFHVAGETTVTLPDAPHETTIWSLPANGDPGNVRFLDLETLRDPVD
jgi:hypothetical protein